MGPAPVIVSAAAELLGDGSGIGLDIVDVQLLKDLIEDGGKAFLDACWTEREQADSQNHPGRLAGRWAAKEAVMKCLGSGIGDLDPSDVEIKTLRSGAPRVVLRGRAAELACAQGMTDCCVSISHEPGWAAAIAIGQRQRSSHSSTCSCEWQSRGGADD